VDAEGQHRGLTLEVSVGTKLASLDATLRKHWQKTEPTVSSSLGIRFSYRGRLLQPGSKIYDDCEIKYRILLGHRGRPDLVQIHVVGLEGGNGSVSGRGRSDVTEAIQEALHGVGTVGELREVVATHLGIANPRRVFIAARDGARYGSIEGDGWLLHAIRQLGFRSLQIEVRPDEGYLVLRMLDRTYIYHATDAQLQQSPGPDMIREWLQRQFLETVSPHNTQSRVKVTSSDIELRLANDRQLASLRWGDDVEFELPIGAAEQFSVEETWLLADTIECNVCCEPRKISEMPLGPITADCDHGAQTCRACLRQWLETSIRASVSETLSCPDCSSKMQYQDIRRQ
jgi:hypothetical protein